MLDVALATSVSLSETLLLGNPRRPTDRALFQGGTGKQNDGAPMTISFPNVSRSFDADKQCISFWGYDSAFEVCFQVGRDALARVVGEPCVGEQALLHAFDTNRPRIHAVATRAYTRRRGSYFALAPTDF